MHNAFAILAVWILTALAAPAFAQMQDVDLILPATLASSDAPFYQEAKVKIGSDIVPVTEGTLPEGTLAQYQPEKKMVVVSNSSRASETAKGEALLEVVAGLQASSIETAAGR